MIAGGRSDRRSTLIAAASTVVFAVLAVLLVTNSPGWPAVKEAFFNREVFRESLEVIPEAFLLNIKIFLIAEVADPRRSRSCIAILRGLPGPVFFPLRALAVVYADFFRGVPTILVIYILGFGAPALQISGVPTDPLFWGIDGARARLLGLRVARSTAPGSSPCTRARRRLLARSGSRARRPCASSCSRRRCAGSIPRSSTTSSGSRRTPRSWRCSAPWRRSASRRSRWRRPSTTRRTSSTALLFVALTVPLARLTDWLVARDRRRQLAAGAALSDGAVAALGRGPAQVVRQARGAEGHRSRRSRRTTSSA